MSSFHQQFTWKVLTVYLFLCVNVSLCLEIDCNRTYTGTIGTKYPLYLKEPIQKFAAFNCQVTFSALGSTHGDIIELSILSFQVGYFPVTKEFPVCEYGYVRIHEKQIKKPANVSSSSSSPLSEASSSQPSSSSSSSSSSSFSSQAIPSVAENSNVGKFCGQLMSRRATFYSQGNNLTLTISLQEEELFQPISTIEYLPDVQILPVNFSPPQPSTQPQQ
ncbi:uncharacterized protein LOC128388715 [Panonychus citri]|uniref:uncharacterized protein LOC128388715 n=1 Tax=Panonychus citri TaxID=50023 RepID=UPI00230777AB|nr:uncharacterized protein LOC128388715 [Panonychus citri]